MELHSQVVPWQQCGPVQRGGGAHCDESSVSESAPVQIVSPARQTRYVSGPFPGESLKVGGVVEAIDALTRLYVPSGLSRSSRCSASRATHPTDAYCVQEQCNTHRSD